MKLSVIIPCYNAATTIAEQLDSFSRQKWNQSWEIIAVDNNSTDNTVDILERYRKRLPNIRIVRAPEKQGQPYALNKGVQSATGEALAFCDADDVVAHGWVAAMGNALLSHDFVSGPFEVDFLNKDGLGKNRVNPQPTGIQNYKYPPFLPHAGSGNMGVRKYVFDQVNGFDESLPILFDTDFCWRVQGQGYKLHAVSGAILHVRFRDTIRGLIRQARRYGEYNVFLYKRYRPLGMPKLSIKKGLREWWKLILQSWKIAHKETRGRWLWQLSWRLGRVWGCIKYRILAL
ncbi:MAG: glycosyltransferase [Gammaproteobacteria bacterium]